MQPRASVWRPSNANTRRMWPESLSCYAFAMRLLALFLLAASAALAQAPGFITDPQQIVSPRQDDLQTLTAERLLSTRTIGGATWSPDGKQIAFTSNISGRQNIWLVPATGGWPTQVTASDQRQRTPAWSPSGKFIAYTSDTDGNEQWNVFIVKPDTGEVTKLTNSPNASQENPAWSPDSRYLAWQARPLPSSDTGLDAISPLSLSPNTSLPSALTGPATSTANTAGGYEIEVFDMLFRRSRALTTGTPRGFDNVRPLWSKDANWIAYTQVRADGKDSSIFIVEVATGKTANLTPHEGEQIYEAKGWSDKEPQIAAINVIAGIRRLVTIDLPSKRLSINPDPDAAPEAPEPSFSSDHASAVFVESHANAPAEIWVYPVGDKKGRQITNSLLAGVLTGDMVAPLPISIPARATGPGNSALLYVPYNQIRNGKAPAIVYMGDPAPDRDFARFDPGLQLLANQGYFVIEPIYGPGKDAVAGAVPVGARDPKADSEILLAAAEWIGKSPYIDPKKLVLMGRGHGAASALHAVSEQADRWAAAILLSPSPTVEKPLAGTQFKLPVLLESGAGDPHAPQAQVQQLVDALRDSGGKIEAKIYEHEGHDFARVEDKIDAWKRITDFLNFNVPAPGCGCTLQP